MFAANSASAHRRFRRSRSLLSLAIVAALSPLMTAPLQADDSAERLEVRGSRDHFRNRTDAVSPQLVYGTEFFAPFEPISVGDMLKRVPGVTFVSDIGEYDFPQLRGVGPEYTQVLINGRPVPGSGAARNLAVDRIPAELVDHIEIIRAPSSDIDGQGVGGTINIVLKDARAVDGGSVRLGASQYEQADEQKGDAFVSWGGGSDKLRLSLSFNSQERYNAKDKFSQFFEEGADVGTERQDDTRDSKDQAFSGALSYQLSNQSELGFSLDVMDTDRKEDELTDTFVDGELDESEFQHERIEELTTRVGADYSYFTDNDMQLKLSATSQRNELDIENAEGEREGQLEIAAEWETVAIDDRINSLSTVLIDTDSSTTIKYGLDWREHERDAYTQVLEDDDGELENVTPGDAVYLLTETRLDAFAMATVRIGSAASLEAGLRAEQTRMEGEGNSGSRDDDRLDWNPSLHYRYQFDSENAFRASLARTLKRAAFNQLVPFEAEDTPDDDQVTVGNPELEPESAWGLDVGFEHRFAGSEGIVGVNAFYRDVQDVVELVQLETDRYSFDNVNDGQIWGIELDAGLPLTALGAPNVSLFANYARLDSEIEDPALGITRRFNNQSPYSYNIGFHHRVEMVGVRYGVSFQRQGDARFYSTEEIVTTSYDGNLELFVEKTLGSNWLLRLNGSNLRDAEKFEFFDMGDETETESEKAGRIWTLTLRGQF